MRRAAALLAALSALATGCGGGDGGGGDSVAPGGAVITQTTAPPAETGGSTAAEAGDVDGRGVFLQNCSGCHTLADAGTTGKVGPNLDESKPSFERARMIVREGGGGGLGVMPRFQGTLTDEQIEAVASYVVDAAGGG
jgi:mono/diheme cytochrome c family protein